MMTRPYVTSEHQKTREIALEIRRAFLAERIRACGATELRIGNRTWPVAAVIGQLGSTPETELPMLERALAALVQQTPTATARAAAPSSPRRPPASRPRRPIFDSVFSYKIIGWE